MNRELDGINFTISPEISNILGMSKMLNDGIMDLFRNTIGFIGLAGYSGPNNDVNHTIQTLYNSVKMLERIADNYHIPYYKENNPI